MVKAAKRRKSDEDEEFRFPEFSEEEYLGKEIELSKATFVTIVLAIPVAALLFGLTIVGVGIVAVFLGFALTFALPRIYKFVPWPKIDLTKFERKDWIGQGGTFFLAWFTILMLLINVPFVDVTAPVIGGLTISQRGTVTTVLPGSTVSPLANETLWINATVFENGAPPSVSIAITGNGTLTPANLPGSPTYSLRIWIFSGNHPVTVTAADESGHTTSLQFTLVVA